MNREQLLSEFQQKIGCIFENTKLLEEALTHPSLSSRNKDPRTSKNYERLEFLGDSVLSMITAEFLIKNYPNEDEGKISKRHAALVRGSTLSGIARQLNIAPLINMTKSEEQGGGRENDHILENIMEALIGAIYLECGLETVKRFIVDYWAEIARNEIKPPKDPRSKLQEMVQSKGKPLPEYNVIKEEGPAHSPVFTVELKVEGFESVTGSDCSKKEAKKKAAIEMLKVIKK